MQQKAKRFVASLPSRKQSRGGSIPDDVHERLFATANGITQQTWGRWPWPWHVQEMFDQGLTEPQQVHDYYGNFAHPHAPGLTLAEYPRYAKAHQTFVQHRG
jgi:hypothetical protein